MNTISRSRLPRIHWDTLSTVSSDFTMIYAHLHLTPHSHTSAHRSQSPVPDTDCMVCMKFVANIYVAMIGKRIEIQRLGFVETISNI